MEHKMNKLVEFIESRLAECKVKMDFGCKILAVYDKDCVAVKNALNEITSEASAYKAVADKIATLMAERPVVVEADTFAEVDFDSPVEVPETSNEMPVNWAFKVYTTCKRLGWLQKEYAERVGVAQSNVSAWAKGKWPPRRKYQGKINELYELAKNTPYKGDCKYEVR